jgi:hypothetical protein
VEFAPGDTPRCVEKGDIAALPASLALAVLERVYGFVPTVIGSAESHNRIEFSVHPTRRGFSQDHAIVWEIEETNTPEIKQEIRWPNSFSRHLGDKLFGLVLADALGFAVPETLAIPRRFPPFRFGRATKSASGIKWVRTCPAIKTPGQFATVRGWADPFSIMQSEDPTNSLISSVIVQDEVEPRYSGALLTSSEGSPLIEGVSGTGEALMLGGKGPTQLPKKIQRDVQKLHSQVHAVLGFVRIEWVHDGRNVWIVQLQQEMTFGTADIIVPANPEPSQYVEFNAMDGLIELRNLIAGISGKGVGILLKGDVGLTSHLADVLRESGIPSKRLPTQPSRPQMRIKFSQ